MWVFIYCGRSRKLSAKSPAEPHLVMFSPVMYEHFHSGVTTPGPSHNMATTNKLEHKMAPISESQHTTIDHPVPQHRRKHKLRRKKAITTEIYLKLQALPKPIPILHPRTHWLSPGNYACFKPTKTSSCLSQAPRASSYRSRTSRALSHLSRTTKA